MQKMAKDMYLIKKIEQSPFLRTIDTDGDESVRSRSVSGTTGETPGSVVKQPIIIDTTPAVGTVNVVDSPPEPGQDTSNLGKGCFIDSL